MSTNKFVEDALELKKAYDDFENKSKAFNEKHRELFLNLLNRYEKVTGNYMENRIGRIINFDQYGDFNVEMFGPEGNWLANIPNHILFDKEVLIFVEEKKEKTRRRKI